MFSTWRGHMPTFLKKKKKSVRITSYQECDTAGMAALKFIVGGRQTNAPVWLYSWEQVCVKLQAGSIYFLIWHGTLIVKLVVY